MKISSNWKLPTCIAQNRIDQTDAYLIFRFIYQYGLSYLSSVDVVLLW